MTEHQKRFKCMDKIMFDSFLQWRICMGAHLKRFTYSLIRLILFSVGGILSLIRWLWRLLVKAVGNYPTVTIVVALGACIIIFLGTYTSGRAKLVTAEFQRDSLSYELSKFTQAYEHGEMAVIGADTIKVLKYGERE